MERQYVAPNATPAPRIGHIHVLSENRVGERVAAISSQTGRFPAREPRAPLQESSTLNEIRPPGRKPMTRVTNRPLSNRNGRRQYHPGGRGLRFSRLENTPGTGGANRQAKGYRAPARRKPRKSPDTPSAVFQPGIGCGSIGT